MTNTSDSMPVGIDCFYYDEIDSTNAEALRKRSQGQEGDCWITAKTQTSGRGRQGKNWVSMQGNMFASLLTQTSCPQNKLSQISLLAGLAALTAIEQTAQNNVHIADLCMKWPNDILLKGSKICGILIESRPAGKAGHFDIVIGCGINLKSAPRDVEGFFPAGNLVDEGWTCSEDELFIALTRSMRDWFSIWRHGEGYETLRLACLQHSCHLGQLLTIEVGNEKFKGRFTTISAQGAIVLESETGKNIELASGHITNIK